MFVGDGGAVARVGRALLNEASTDSTTHSTTAHADDTAVLWFMFISLAAGTAARTALHGTSIPYTVVLFCIGMLLAVVYYYTELGHLEASLDAWNGINPHLLLAVFLPALIFESSFSMEWHTLKKVLPKVLILAGPGVLLSMALTGCVLRIFPFGWSWAFCMMVGSILAATDPVAVVAILKEVGASKVLGHMIEGESLVNDGTAIVVFNVFLAIASGESKTFGEVILALILQPLESVLIGVVFGQCCLYWISNSHRDHLVEITITLFAGYISFMVAESVVKCSGVLAVVVLGTYITANGRTQFKGDIQHSMHHFWEVLTYAANTIIFILAGFLIIADILIGQLDIRASDLGWGILLYLILNVIRLIVVAMLFPWMNHYRGHTLTLREALIAVWSGLRGAVGLALALVVLEESEAFTPRERGLTLVMVASAVIGTLLINASTAALMLRLAGLLTPGLSHERTIVAARKAIHERALKHYEDTLKETGAQYLGAPDFTAIKQLVPFLRTQVETADVEFSEEIAKLDAQLMHEMRGRFLAGLCKEIWSMLEDDLCDASVAQALLIACERAADLPMGTELSDLREFLNFLKPNQYKARVVAYLDKRVPKLLKVARFLKVVDEPWMAIRREMQGLHALISAHQSTAETFRTLLGKAEHENKDDETMAQELAAQFGMKKATGENLANETSMKSDHVRDVILESEVEVTEAVEMLKALQHSHNAIARSLRSEALAREILEVTLAETKLLTHTGLLDESEGSMLQAEHDTYLQRLIMHPLPPTLTSPGRILSAIPFFDPTQPCGIKNRDTRSHFLREAEVIEIKAGEAILDPDLKLRNGMLLVGNGVVRIEDAHDPTQYITAGCKSHPRAWALAMFEELVNRSTIEDEGVEPARSGIRAIAQTDMFGFILPHALMKELYDDLREQETIDFLWRCSVGLLAETVLKASLKKALPDITLAKFVSSGKLVRISQGVKLEPDARQVVVLLKGSLYSATCGNLPTPSVVTFKRSDMKTATSLAERLLESKLESRLSALRIGKNGLARASHSNLQMLVASESETKEAPEEDLPEEVPYFECMTDVLLYVIPLREKKSPSSALLQSREGQADKKKEKKRAAFLRNLTVMSRGGAINDVVIEADIEAAAGAAQRNQRRSSMSSVREPPHREAVAIEEDPAVQFTVGSSLDTDHEMSQLTTNSMPDHPDAQLTHLSDTHEPITTALWDDSPVVPGRSRRSMDHPSTQYTIS